jgi:apolipoprotein N-acyltransferase
MLRFSRIGWRSLAGLVLSAALLGVYSHGGFAYLLGFIALVPWLLVLNLRPTIAAAICSGVLMSIAFVAAVFAWFGAAIGEYVGIGSAAGLLLVLLGAPLLQIQIIVFAFVRHIVGRRYGALVRALAGASAWVATEWLVPKLLGDTIGHGLYPSQTLRQVADVAGAAGLTFLLIVVNECVALAITHRRDGARLLLKPLVVAASLLIMMLVYGGFRVSELTPANNTSEKLLRIGMVQSNIVDYERLRREMGAYEVVRHVLDTHYAMSRDAINNHRVDALLWSETVYPTTFGHAKSEGGAELDREILNFVSTAKIPLVFGTYDLDDSGEYNAAAFVEPSAGTLGFYRKTNLFLFTEYVPSWLDGPIFRRWLPWTGAWKKGSGARVFPLRLADGREIPVLPMICLDDVDSNLGIDGARLGAQVILSMSNDSWFTHYPVGAELHQTVAAFRSIETRLPQMRVTANGISSVIDAGGNIIASTGMGEKKLLIGEVAITAPHATLMLAWGNWLGGACLAFLALLVAVSAADPFKQRAASAISTTALEKNFGAQCVVLSPLWRSAAAALQLLSCGGLLWMAKAMLFGDGAETNTLTQIEMFAGLVLAPQAAVWAIMRAFSASMQVENGMLVLEQRERRIEIPIQDITTMEPWKFPLPTTGINLRLQSGQAWSRGIATTDFKALISALIHAGGRPALANLHNGFAVTYARARQSVLHWRIDHPLIKFVLFPLVPALPAFRLHQNIAFGGSFGEYYTFGLKAYLIAFLIWWACWAIGMVLFAALLRVVIEVVTIFSIFLRADSAGKLRNICDYLGRLLFFVGVPAWLLMQFWRG